MIAQDPRTHGAVFVPTVWGSDKTTVSVATGQNDYYPLYMSLGNIRNNVRRAHRDSVVLVGFLAIPKSELAPIIFSFLQSNPQFGYQLKRNTIKTQSIASFADNCFTPHLRRSWSL